MECGVWGRVACYEGFSLGGGPVGCGLWGVEGGLKGIGLNGG